MHEQKPKQPQFHEGKLPEYLRPEAYVPLGELEPRQLSVAGKAVLSKLSWNEQLPIPRWLRSANSMDGRGRVFLAFDLKIGKEVVLKRSQLSGIPLLDYKRYAEARATDKLPTQGIVPIYDTYVDKKKNVLYMSMEKLDPDHNLTLHQYLKENTNKNSLPSLGMCVWIIRELCGLIDQWLEKGIVHQDLKLANLILTRFGSKMYLRALDWGSASHVKPAEHDSDALQGTMGYYPPVRDNQRYQHPASEYDQQEKYWKIIDTETALQRELFSALMVFVVLLQGYNPYVHKDKTMEEKDEHDINLSLAQESFLLDATILAELAQGGVNVGKLQAIVDRVTGLNAHPIARENKEIPTPKKKSSLFSPLSAFFKGQEKEPTSEDPTESQSTNQPFSSAKELAEELSACFPMEVLAFDPEKEVLPPEPPENTPHLSEKFDPQPKNS
jgi:serine/threonine protein kinase